MRLSNKKNGIYFLAIFSLLLYGSCDLSRYSKAILEENQIARSKNKDFIRSISFEGVIKEKESAKGNLKYILHIAISKIDDLELPMEHYAYVPYYKFSREQLDIVASKELYQAVSPLDTIVKQHNSDYVIIKGNKQIRLLSSDSTKWLP